MALDSLRRHAAWPRLVGRLRDPLDLDRPSWGKTLLVGAVVLSLAVLLGLATAAIGNGFDDRPLFLLAVPLLVVIGVALAVNPQGLLVGLVLSRAILNPLFAETRLAGLGGLGGVLNLTVIALALTLLVRARIQVPRTALTTWLPFLALAVLGLLHAPDLVPAFRTVAAWSTYAAVFLCAFYCVKDEADLDRMLKWLLLSSVPVLAYSILGYLTGNLSHQLQSEEGTRGRLAGPLGHPNVLAFYLVIIVAAWLARSRVRPAGPALTPANIGWGLHLLVVLGVLAGTQTRGAWAGVLLLFLLYGLFVRRIYLLYIGLALVGALAMPGVGDRLAELGSNNEVYTYSRLNSLAWRQYIWESGIAWMSAPSYLWGNGIDAFKVKSVEFFPLANGTRWGAHNVFVQVFFDLGAVGVLLFIGLFARPVIALWRSGLDRNVRLMLVALVGAYLFGCFSDNMMDYLVVNWNLWFLLGLACALASRSPVTAGPQARDLETVRR
ncbi:O-antigen ligase family protein [Pseudorhodoferax sp.]|uniref:O-antigen ligase family protein n=1 Tax=Pseudorhodoferax sp. TaxID=1993553 RepID=UPI002DD61F40|nr:O-antigen ligase family protein [Pseudorhodoferax sp.]